MQTVEKYETTTVNYVIPQNRKMSFLSRHIKNCKIKICKYKFTFYCNEIVDNIFFCILIFK